jgi:hypothetical protein
MAMEQTIRLCRLEAAVGKTEQCPGNACPFWEPGDTVLHGRCAVEELGVVADAALARWLLEIRGKLAAASSEDEQRTMRSVFHQLLNESAE